MAVPDYQSFMLPLLRFAADGMEHNQSEAKDALSRHFNITESDRREMLPSGRQTRFDNRIAWANVYLRKAGFLESTRRGHFRITGRGQEILKMNPDRIDVKFLVKNGDPEFCQFHRPSRQNENHDDPGIDAVRTPREITDTGYQEMRRDLSGELLNALRAAHRCSLSIW